MRCGLARKVLLMSCSVEGRLLCLSVVLVSVIGLSVASMWFWLVGVIG